MSNIKKDNTDETKSIINNLIIQSIDRSTKDIKDWRVAHITAESIYAPNRTRLYDIYEDIQLDGHLTGIIGKRINNVLNKNIYFEKDGERVEELDILIESEVFRNIIKEVLNQQLWGLTGLEFLPGKEITFNKIPRKHIKPHKRIIALNQHNYEAGIPYDGINNVIIIGDKDDFGLLLKCAPYALYKRGNLADWAQYIEIFGQPVRIVRYDTYDENTKMELREVLDESGSSLALMIPKQADFEMLDGKGSNGDGQLQERFHIAVNNEMSIIILGNTETTSSSKSSGYAQSKEHGDQQKEIIKSDIKFITNFLNSKKFIDILDSYGLPVIGGKFCFEKELDITFLKEKLGIDVAISEKVPISDDHWYETYGISKPENYDELKAAMQEKAKAPTAKALVAEPEMQNTWKKRFGFFAEAQ